MQYSITHSTTYTYSEKVSPCHNQVHLAPRRTTGQECEYHQLVVQPPPSDRDTRIDYFGNQVDYFTILEPHSRLMIDSTSRVAVTPRALPDPDGIAPATVMNVTLSCDHRVVDGASGAALLSAFKAFIEDPVRMLV